MDEYLRYRHHRKYISLIPEENKQYDAKNRNKSGILPVKKKIGWTQSAESEVNALS